MSRKKKIIIIILCVTIVFAFFSAVLLTILKQKSNKQINEQTQVVEFINKINQKLIKNPDYLDYGCTMFDNRKESTIKSPINLSSIDYKEPLFGYVFVEDVLVDDPKLASFSESIIYTSGKKTIKQITNYEFYFKDSEVAGTRYASNYTYSQTDNSSTPYNISYDINYDEKFSYDVKFLKNIVNVKNYYDPTLEVAGKEYDWTKSIQKACEEINKTGGLLYFPYDTYHMSVKKDDYEVLSLNSEHEIVVDFCNSKLIVEANNLGLYRAVSIRKCGDITIKNGTLQGDRMLHDYSDPGFGQFRETHEGGDGINVRSAVSAKIYNMEIYDFTGDAIGVTNSYDTEIYENGDYGFIGSASKVNIDKCILHHCRRQGVSVLDFTDFSITNTEIYSIGMFTWAYPEDCSDPSLKNLVVKGTAPSAGIDFEPDRCTFIIEKALVDNCFIHNTDNYSMVNVTLAEEAKEQGYEATTLDLVINNTLASSFPCITGANNPDPNHFRQAVIKNSTLVWDKALTFSGFDENGNLKENLANMLTKIRMYNCNIVKTLYGDCALFIEDCEFYNCVFEQNVYTINNTIGFRNGYISFARAKLVDNVFSNLVGSGENSSYYYSHGVVFMTGEEDGGGIAEGSTGNSFINSSVFLRRSVTLCNEESGYNETIFYKCKVYAYPSSTEIIRLKNITFQDCDTKANSGAQLIFENCRFLNSGAFAHYDRKFINCYIEINDLEENLVYTDENDNSYGVTPFGGRIAADSKPAQLYGTTIVIKNNILYSDYNIKAFNNSYFYDNCSIVINKKYQSKTIVLKEQENRSIEISYSE